MAVLSRTGVLGVLLCWLIAGVCCRPTGAPGSACTSLSPDHENSVSQPASSSLFTITANTSDFMGGQVISVIVSSSSLVKFRGVLLQARVVNTDTPVGTFMNVPDGFKILQCGGENNSVTHSSNDFKSSLIVNWVAPNNAIGNIEFVGTVVYTREVFWSQLRSDVITASTVPDSCASDPCFNGGTCYTTTGAYFCGCPDPANMGPNCEMSPCIPNPCLNGGVCFRSSQTPTNFACRCFGNYGGQHCENVIALCSPNPCLNGGICQQDGNEYSCFCPPDRHGTHCEFEIIPCSTNPCLNGTSCLDTATGHKCVCSLGWSGDNCEISLICQADSCFNGGTCYDSNPPGSMMFHCQCDVSYTGSRCQTADPCRANPCANSGTCNQVGDSVDFTCSCLNGFEGERCETTSNPCQNSPCLNGGTCFRDTNGDTQCQCPSDYEGNTCQTRVHSCLLPVTPCMNGGICFKGTSNPFSYVCQCQTGYSGVNCENLDISCSSSPCRNGGECTQPGGGNYQCECTSVVYSGINCEIYTNPCESDPCVNGICRIVFDSPTGRSCTCDENYGGENCTDYIGVDACASYPCQNGGSCNSSANQYVCSCTPEFFGPNCQNRGACFGAICQNGATCIPRDDQLAYTCQCAPSYDGEYCQYANTCELDNPCLFGSTCRYIGQGFSHCDCPTGLAGTFCEVDISCSSSPCRNGGECTQPGGGNYQCECTSVVYSGINCEIYTNPCESDPCVNGICRIVFDSPTGRSCTCDENYGGENCTDYIGVDACASYPCQNGGSCNSSANQYVCSCTPEFFGPNCQNRGACFGAICQNGATCIPRDDQLAYTCQCAPSYDGEYCQYANTCELDNPCLFGSTCRYIGQGFSHCDCPTGLAGTFCEVDISCSSSPCRNGGECTQPGGGNYQCECTSVVYSGINCEIYTNPCESDPCVNGICRIVFDSPTGRSCTCDENYGGENCTDYIGDGCAMFDCFNGGTCFNDNQGPTCVCGPEFAGEHCERPTNLPPTFNNCPSGSAVSFPLDMGSNEAYIDLPRITAVDQENTQLDVEVTDGLQFPTTITFTEEYREGKEIAVRAEDGEGRISICSFRLRIFDDESPSVQCPTDVSAITAEASVAITFPMATATDNLGITEPLQYTPANGSQFTPGSNTVLVKALDTFGNQGECSFKVVVHKKESDCTSSTAPENGISTCVVEGERKTCSVSCNQGFGNAVGVNEYMCVYETPAYWQPRPNTDICVPFKPGNGASQVVSIRFSIDSALCNSLNFDISVTNSLTAALQGLGVCATNDATMSCNFELDCVGFSGGGRRRRANTNLNVDIDVVSVAGQDDTTADVTTRLDEAVDTVKAGAATGSLSIEVEGETIMNEPTALGETETTWNCKPGQVTRLDGCLSCPPGTYYDASTNTCSQCPANTHQNKAEQESCTPCPEGRETMQNGAYSVDHCLVTDKEPLAGPWTPTLIGIVGGAGGLIVLLLVTLACVLIIKNSRQPSRESHGDTKADPLSNFTHLNKAYEEDDIPEMEFHGLSIDSDNTYQNVVDDDHTPTGSTDHLVRIPSLSQYSDYYATLNARSAPNLEPETPPPPPPVSPPEPPTTELNGGPPSQPPAPPAPPAPFLNTNNSNTSTGHAHLNGSVVANGGSRAKFQV